MTEADTIRSMSDIADGKRMFGRTKIMLDYDAIDSGNILEALGRAVAIHDKNAAEIEYLWRYYCGDQPVLKRTKAVRPEINNKIVVNVANEIVSFKVGYQVGEPVQYVSRTTTSGAMNSVMKLNEFMFSEDKAAQDQEVRQEYWSGLPCPPSGDLPNPEIEPGSTPLQADTLPSEPPGKPSLTNSVWQE